MVVDKYTATWVSYSSLNDFLKCPRLYYLKNVYRDPENGHKIQIISPPLSLGQVVHEVLESISLLPTDSRFNTPLMEKFEHSWKKVNGKKGGFVDKDVEEMYKQRGQAMIRRVMDNPGPLARKAVKIREELPQFWLSQDEGIILCGKLDWLEYLPETDSVHIIDFKTSKKEEDQTSLQLPIYYLLASNAQKRKVERVSYWYLELSDSLIHKDIPTLEECTEEILETAKELKLKRKLDRLTCSQTGGCTYCRIYERILAKKAEFVGTNDYGTDLYFLPSLTTEMLDESYIL